MSQEMIGQHDNNMLECSGGYIYSKIIKDIDPDQVLAMT